MASSSLLVTLLATCSLNVSSNLLQPLIQLESNFNPYAIGVVGSSVKQPDSLDSFIETISDLNIKNKNYSVGLAQINIKNLNRFKIPVIDAIEPCNNIKLSSFILKECYKKYNENIGKTLSCYYSGNDKTGFERDFNNSYVERFLSSYSNKKEDVVIDFDYDQFFKLRNQVKTHKTTSTTNNSFVNTNTKKTKSTYKKKFFAKSINTNN